MSSPAEVLVSDGTIVRDVDPAGALAARLLSANTGRALPGSWWCRRRMGSMRPCRTGWMRGWWRALGRARD